MAEEKDLTPDERMQWLRDRGILIETPEERKAKSGKETEDCSSSTGEEISYVLVPSDSSVSMQEFVFKSKGGSDCLLQHLRPAFAKDSPKVDLSLLQQPAQLQSGGSETPQVSEDTLKKVAEEGLVEIFNLVHATPSNNFLGINIYLDEIGLLKRLPLNKRASDYAKESGYNPPPQFYGDVFFGRVRKSGALVVQNVSFRLAELNPNSDWLQQAATQNLEYQMQMNEITGRNDVQPEVAGSNGVAKNEQAGYSWTQTEEELEVVAVLPNIDVKSKDLQVKFKPRHVQIMCQHENLVSFTLFEHVDVDGCTWTIEKSKEKGKIIVVTMEKREEALWPRIEN